MLVTVLILAGLAAAPGAEAVSPSYAESVKQAREALAGGDSVLAMALLDRALRLNPEGADSFVLLGQAYRRLGSYDEAERALARAVELLGEQTPAGQDALAELAAAFGDEQRNEDAIAALRKVIALAPGRHGTHRDLGMIYLVIGRLEEAVGEFRKEIALHPPGERDAVTASANEGLGVAAYKSGDDVTALDALSKSYDTIKARYHIGLALARQGRSEEAAAAFREVLRREPDHRGALQNLARVAAILNLEDERRRSLDRFQELYRKEEETRALRVRVRELRQKADDRMTAGDVTGAVAAMEQATTLDPDNVDSLLILGWLYWRGGDVERSEQVYRRALGKDPLRAELHYRLGRLLSDRGELSDAISSLEQAARLQPMALPYHVTLAQAYLRVNRAEDGVRELRLARRLNPSDPAGQFNLGLGLAQAGHLREAAMELEAAVKLGYNDPAVHQALAQVYRTLGDTERSAREQRILEGLASQGSKP